MTEIAPSVFFPRIVKHCTIVLAKPEFSTVTVEEFAIMNTPEGELYDKSVQKRLVDKYSFLLRKNDLNTQLGMTGQKFGIRNLMINGDVVWRAKLSQTSNLTQNPFTYLLSFHLIVYLCQLWLSVLYISFFHRAKLTEAAKRQNMKKESKAYSYEDQIWEMEVREVC